FLRPERSEDVATIRSRDDSQELRLALAGFSGSQVTLHAAADEDVNTTYAIAEHIFKSVVGTHSLVFANSRQKVEEVADTLGQLCVDNHI
ncbi:UNVERIFIED_CONTAM: ATP-dependent helicase, partial [Bacteroidetes bacterium 56_B9]